MGTALQSRDIASVAIAVDCTVLGKRALGKLFDSGPLDILRDLHLDMAGISPHIQKYNCKNLLLFCATVPFLPNGRPAEAYGSCGAPSPLSQRSGGGTVRIDTGHWTAHERNGNRISGRQTRLITAVLPAAPGILLRWKTPS